MKKIFSLLCLLVILLPAIVNADTISVTDISDTSWASGNSAFYLIPEDMPDAASLTGQTKMYRDFRTMTASDGSSNGGKVYIYHYNNQNHKLRYNGKEYPSMCMDPALKNAHSSMLCDSMPEDEAGVKLKYLLTKYNDYVAKNWTNENVSLYLAVRAIAYKGGYHTSGDKILNEYFMHAIYNAVALKQDHGLTMAEMSESDTHKTSSLSYRDAKTPQGRKTLTRAREIYQEAENYYQSYSPNTQLAADGTQDLLFVSDTPTSADRENLIFKYTITTKGNFNLNINDIIVTCVSGCTGSNLSLKSNGHYGDSQSFELTVSGVCKFEIDVSYNSSIATDVLYLCYKSDATRSTSTNQKFLFLATDKKPTHKIRQIDSCGGPCECPDQYYKNEVNMCCETETKSEIAEPLVNNLFCYKKTDDFEVDSYTSKCDAFKVSHTDTGLSTKNTYCTLYCTERVIVQIPPSIGDATNGKYFTLPSVSGHPESTGPYFDGKRTCRMLTHYDVWLTEYKSQTATTNTAFNTYQAAKAKYDMYQDLYKLIGKAKVHNLESSEQRDIYYTGSYTSKCTGDTIPVNVTDDSVSCKTKYTYDVQATSYDPVDYKQSKIVYYDDKSGIKDYKGLYVDNDTKGTTSIGSTGKYDVIWASSDCGKSDSKYSYTPDDETCAIPAGSPPGTVAQVKTYSAIQLSYNGVEDKDPTDIKKTLDTEKDNASEAADKAEEAYNNNVDTLNDLEKYLTECDDYFTPKDGLGTIKVGNGDYEDKTIPFKLYNMKPDVSFRYFTVYLNSETRAPEEHARTLPFKVKCEYTFTEMGNSSDDELGLKGYQYNTLNGNKDASVTNFNAYTFCLNDSAACNNFKDVTSTKIIDETAQTHSQRYTSDAYYTALCKSNDEDSNTYLVYPYGNFSYESEDATEGYAGFKKSSYFIEYSTFDAKYETYWLLSNVGTSKDGVGKFDEDFTLKKTCSGSDNGSESLLSCSLRVKEALTKISGCNEEDTLSMMVNSDNHTHWKYECCTNCDPEDTLTYTFKTVDSDVLFPDGGVVMNNGQPSGTTYAYNWLVAPNGVSAKNEIEAVAASDKTFAPERISFEFSLSSSDLDVIKEYNSSHPYNDFNLTCKSDQDASGNDIRFYNCISKFITEFYGGSVGNNDITYPGNITKLNSVRTDANSTKHLYNY